MIYDLLGKTAPGLDAPIDVLEACHQRIASQCDTLEKLLAHLPLHGADRQAQQAARAVLRYFDVAAVHHHDDEERNLFPLLQAAHAPGACELAETLTLEHEEQARLWRSLRIQLAAIETGASAALDAARASRFIDANRAHLAFENTHVLPLARVALDAAALQRLGRAMAARRGLDYPGATT
ncbi:MAG: hemerythrin domain-containing protein [Thiobacillus sp.]|nr:hemerythrin domain-containing protein [Thiobacillus sp.]